jgi:hypothetical protein
MTHERAGAYRRVLKTLDDLGPSRLLRAEQERVRLAADSLLFCRDLRGDPAAREALEDIERLCRALVDSNRWVRDTAMRLADDVSQCGPALLPELEAA